MTFELNNDNEKLLKTIFNTLRGTILPSVCNKQELERLIKDYGCLELDYEDEEHFNINYKPIFYPVMLDKYTELDYILFGYSHVECDNWQLDTCFDYYLHRTVHADFHGEVQL